MISGEPPNRGSQSQYTVSQHEHYKSTLNSPPEGRRAKFCIFCSKEMSFNIYGTPFVDGGPQCVHYNGPANLSVTLGNALTPATPTAGKQHTKYDDCPSTLCLQTDTEGYECCEYLNCAEVPEHFKRAHGIDNLPRDRLLVCNWQGCGSQVIRHNYVRHIRECHLKHDRTLGHENQVLICTRWNELGTADWIVSRSRTSERDS
ncbi:hypothetical protein EDD16DRAFT_1555826 [Pisolithus croceorrhizus]|nr:hypothetical protein EV401DRAFT_1991160 [Pisolithus croceorrhizus]KAI6126149.1 hypothetical protein EDD16DRAFT_1555826 [Pisolithus croceorrhizus]